MSIHRLPQHLINKLKAGEIVERPASLLKELLENSLDAGATELQIWIEQWGKKLIKIQDNGSGIWYEDLPLVLERYATSKILTEEDLEHISSYGFRGEALASIAEVSRCVIQTKRWLQTTDKKPQLVWSLQSEVWGSHGYQLQKINGEIKIEPMSMSYDHGTTVIIEDIFCSIPARHKYLKADLTEWGYVHTLLIDYLLIHHEKSWKVWNNGKLIREVNSQSLMERVAEMFNKDRLANLSPFERSDGTHTIYGCTSRAALHFWSPNYIHIFVNQRPVTDKIIKKAILESYQRQLVPGTYPCTVLFLDIKPDLVDVNVHPRKTEVKFLDPKTIFTIVKNTIDEQIGNQKVSYAHFNQKTIQEIGDQKSEIRYWQKNDSLWYPPLEGGVGVGLFTNTSFANNQQFANLQSVIIIDQKSYHVVSQLRNMYILLEGEDGLLLVDQHALAERIAFEKMKLGFQTSASEILLTPLVVSYPKTADIDTTIEQLNTQGWDVSRFGEGKIVVYAVPWVFQTYQLDLELVLNHIRGRESIDFWIILDEIAGMKACKASIKAGQSLSLPEMQQLLQDGVTYITGMFVCQHGRPSVVAIKKSQLDGMFER